MHCHMNGPLAEREVYLLQTWTNSLELAEVAGAGAFMVSAAIMVAIMQLRSHALEVALIAFGEAEGEVRLNFAQAACTGSLRHTKVQVRCCNLIFQTHPPGYPGH
jgi:hypothetical protein